MNITEETQKLTGNPMLRYAILVIGVLLLIFSQGILTWKRTSPIAASGNVASIELDINYLKKNLLEAKDSGEKKEIREKIKTLKEEKLEDARMDVMEERVDAQNGIWFWNMVRVFSIGIVSLGLVVITALGSNYEKVGGLVALGFILSNL